MTSARDNDRDLAIPRNSARDQRKPVLLRLLDAVAACDARYRAARRLRDMPDERLADMGLSRRDAETAYDRTRWNVPPFNMGPRRRSSKLAR